MRGYPIYRPATGGDRPNLRRFTHPYLFSEQGMVGWWPMQGSLPSVLYDRVFGQHTGTISGSMANLAVAHFPEFGAVAESNGPVTHELLYDPLYAPYLSGTEASMSAWVKLRNASPVGSGFGFPFTWDGDLFGPSEYVSTFDGLIYCGTLRASRVNGSPRADVNRADWHLVTITTKPGASGWTFWQNAKVAFQATGDATLPVAIWRRGLLDGSSTIFLDGWVCDIRLWNRCLNDEEVYNLWAPQTRWDIYQRKAPAAYVDWTERRQTGFRFRDDDGSEATASPLAAQNVHISRDKEVNTRLRVQIVSVDPDTSRYSLQYRKKGTSDNWRTVQP